MWIQLEGISWDSALLLYSHARVPCWRFSMSTYLEVIKREVLASSNRDLPLRLYTVWTARREGSGREQRGLQFLQVMDIILRSTERCLSHICTHEQTLFWFTGTQTYTFAWCWLEIHTVVETNTISCSLLTYLQKRWESKGPSSPPHIYPWMNVRFPRGKVNTHNGIPQAWHPSCLRSRGSQCSWCTE